MRLKAQKKHLVVDVRNVHDKVNVVAKVVHHYSTQYVLSHIISEMPKNNNLAVQSGLSPSMTHMR